MEFELSMVQWLLHVDTDASKNAELLAKVAGRLGVEPEWLEAAPGVLVGSAARCAEKLHEIRQRLGISNIQVHAGPHGVDLSGIGPVVAELAGT